MINPEIFKLPAEKLARQLLGKKLVYSAEGVKVGGIIVETEAYDQTDPSSHSFVGRTDRNSAMFKQGGHIYVYKIYGIHHCLNIVADQKGFGAAVLIRALEPTIGIEKMLELRETDSTKNIASGPGKITQAMGIDLSLSGLSITNTALEIREGIIVGDSEIGRTPRIGISKATDKKLRFIIKDSEYLSR